MSQDSIDKFEGQPTILFRYGKILKCDLNNVIRKGLSAVNSL